MKNSFPIIQVKNKFSIRLIKKYPKSVIALHDV